MTPMLNINEIFHSIQGESTWAGLPCVFVRLRGCHLRCCYCDTEYAFHQGEPQTIDDIVAQVRAYACDLVEVTGGEPLLQKNVHPLMTRLCDLGKTVLLETSGACDISTCDARVIRIFDLKTPDSGEVEKNRWANIAHLRTTDEIKFVLCSRADYEWARDIISRYNLPAKVKTILVSTVHEVPVGLEIAGLPQGGPPLDALTQWILEDRLPVRLQTQLHKLIWHPATRGV